MTNITAGTENQLIHYHSNHHSSKVQMKPECSCFYINNRSIVIEINAFSLQQMFEMMSFRMDACRRCASLPVPAGIPDPNRTSGYRSGTGRCLRGWVGYGYNVHGYRYT